MGIVWGQPSAAQGSRLAPSKTLRGLLDFAVDERFRADIRLAVSSYLRRKPRIDTRGCNGELAVRQGKAGAQLTLLIRPELQAIVDATPSRHITE